jgi:NADP-dependent 3-hydroxy acid dehydrogenase YdfG
MSYNKLLMSKVENSIKPATKSFVPKFESKIQNTVHVNSAKIQMKNINSGKINSSLMEQMHNLKSSLQNSKSLKDSSFTTKEEVTFSVEQKDEVKDIKNFMDMAIKVTPENIMKSV